MKPSPLPSLRSIWSGVPPELVLEPGDYDAFEVEYTRGAVRDIALFVATLTLFNLAFWLTDAWVFRGVPGAAETLSVGRAVTLVLAVILLVGLRLRPERVLPMVFVAAFLTCLTVGAMFGRIGPPGSAWFHFVYPFALAPAVWFLRPPRRLLVNLTFSGGILAAYFLPNPEHLADPMALSAVAHLGYVTALGFGVGLHLDRSRLRVYALQRTLERERGALAQRVAEQTHELRRLARRLDAVVESERVHLARELHDELGQMLTAVRIVLRVATRRYEADVHAIGGNLAQLAGLLDQVTARVRALLRELRPPVLDDLGLAAALEWLTTQSTQNGGPPCVLTAPDGRLDVPEEVAVTVYRCVQEALTNVARHAHATRVDVSLARDGEGLVVTVADDGVGLGAGRGDGLGLVGMRERAAALGGTLSVVGKAGTTVTVRIPLARPEAA